MPACLVIKVRPVVGRQIGVGGISATTQDIFIKFAVFDIIIKMLPNMQIWVDHMTVIITTRISLATVASQWKIAE